MNTQFTKSIGDWLDTAPESRDYQRGAELLFKLNHNQIMFRNLSMNPAKKANVIEYELQKFYKKRIADFTHEEVGELKAQADKIAISHGLQKVSVKSELQSGKRADHDSLPENIKALYVENLDLRNRMREVHTRLRILSETKDSTVCPDSDLYPFCKELIALDKKYRSNWQVYDAYSADKAAPAINIDSREKSKKALRLVNLNKGKFAKNRSESLAAQIRDWYKDILNPSEKLVAELTELGII